MIKVQYISDLALTNVMPSMGYQCEHLKPKWAPISNIGDEFYDLNQSVAHFTNTVKL